MTILFVILAAICNAVMDCLEYDTVYDKSIFRKYNPKWWLKSVSWQYSNFLPFTKYRLDGWHLFKSLTIFNMMGAVVVYTPIVNFLIDFVILGTIWIVIFNLFYNKIFRK